MICLIDNYDSFTYNLYQYVGEINPDIFVIRNDKITVEEIINLNPSHIIISPGPGHPADSGIIVETVKKLSGRIPILGICLGHQAIGLAMGGEITLANDVVHGKQSSIHHDGKGLFCNIPDKFLAVRYHSLCIKPETIPDCLEVHAKTEDGTIMAIKHRTHRTYGIQYHPESILTEYGKVVLGNFIYDRAG